MRTTRLYIYTFVIGMATLSTFKVRAQVPQYPVSAIPEALLKDAHTVIREEQKQLNVKDARTATMSYHKVITILDSKGDDDLTFHMYSSAFNVLTDATIKVYNAEGALVNTYSKKEMQVSGYGEGLIDDGKVTYFKVTAPTYPITLQFDYHEKYKGILQYPVYQLQDEDQSVQQSSCQVIVPADLGFRYKTVHSAIKTDKKIMGAQQSYSWSVKDLKAVSVDPEAGPDYQYLPQVVMAANKFNMDGYFGDMSSWKGLGSWVNSLNGKDNELSATQIAFYQNMVKTAAEPLDKARILYQYLQDNMRYVSIQLGIGGWKPFAASFVSDKKYGDCKALSNFMQAALAGVGVKSYPAIIYAGDSYVQISEDFPISCFNHEILCIPSVNGSDTTWLECTSNTAKFGKLGYSTADHYAVLITPEGGHLVKTPAASFTDNSVGSYQLIHIGDQGQAKLESRLNGTGYFRELFLDALYERRPHDQQDFLTKGLGYKQTDSIKVEEGLKTMTPYPFKVQLAYSQYQDFASGSKLFIASRPLNLYFEHIKEDTSRKQDYYFTFPYQITDTTVIVLADNLTPEDLPADKKSDWPFGRYESHYSMDKTTHTITIVSRLQIIQSYVKAQAYQDLYKFALLASNDLDEKIVLQKTDNE